MVAPSKSKTLTKFRGAAVTEPRRRFPPRLLSQLRAAFTRLVEIENNPSIDWVALLELREHADPLTDDAWLRGYVMGILDALGVSVTGAVPLLGTPTKPKRRIVQAGGARLRSESLASRKVLPGNPSKDEEHAGE